MVSGWVDKKGGFCELFNMNGGCCRIVVLKGMFVTNGGVWKAIFCSLTVYFSGSVCEKTNMPMSLSTVGGVVLPEITANCCAFMEALCSNAVAEDVGPSTVSLRDSFIGSVVIVETPFCDVSLVTGVRMGAVTGSNDIIVLIGLVGDPPVPPVSPDAIFKC
ncbi:unnamed protein product [Lactuca virosa]|uniref:Uncharacterized protein n=1 Tax=Lactuca virosa TaxID=75947 RepID=A0AAU9NRY0_9ASTR|nr:unnamed protein product [Lactuca virosa]